MDRRKLLLGAASAGATLLLPKFAFGWWQHYELSAAEREELLTDAYRSARSRLKPLLVYLVPPDAESRATHERAEALQKLIESGNNAELATLAICEVVCAGENELKRLVPNAQTGPDVLLVLVETDRAPPTARSIEAPAKDIARAIKKAVTIRAGSRAARGRPAWVASELSLWRITPQEAELHAPYLWFLAQREASVRATLEEKLAASVKARFEKYVPGSRWGWMVGCGSYVVEPMPEEDVITQIGCGMGYTSQKANRFLAFFAKKRARW